RAAAEQSVIGKRGRIHTGQLPHAPREVAPQLTEAGPGILRPRGPHAHGNNVIAIHSEVAVQELLHAAQEQGTADEQQHRQRTLGHDEHAPNGMRPTRAAPIRLRPCARNDVARSTCVARNAGKRPNSSKHASVIAAVNASTRVSGVVSMAIGLEALTVMSNTRAPHVATNSPSTLDTIASNVPSTSICCINRPRPAPSVMRSVISRLRAAVRAS